MRDLIDLVSNLNESRGLSAREPGEEFQRIGNPDDIIVFQGLDFYPKTGSYTSMELMLSSFEKVNSQLNPPAEQVNRPSAATKAFAIASFDTKVGARYLVKFVKDINAIRTKNTFFQTTDIPGGYTYKTIRAQKETVGYKPSQVLTNFKSQTPDSIYQQIMEKFGQDSAIGQATTIFYQATSFPITIPAKGIDFAGFRDYFCEILQPVALVQGKPIQGNAAKAAEIFLGGDFSDCVISFNEGASGGLYDSILVAPNGKQIKLSSKGGRGAMASVVNLLRAARELESSGRNDLIKQHQDTIDILEVIKQGDHWTGPIKLAELLGLIDEQEARSIVPKLKPLTQAVDIDQIDISDNLKKIYKERKIKNPSKLIPLEHMTASLAYTVCNLINTETNFSEAAADILNNSALVQMYTKAKQQGDSIIIEGFNTVWPSKTYTQVTIEAEKSYSSTSSSAGRLVFNINQEPKAVPNVDTGAGAVPGTDQDIADYKAPRTDLSAADTAKPVDQKALGRGRRKNF